MSSPSSVLPLNLRHGFFVCCGLLLGLVGASPSLRAFDSVTLTADADAWVRSDLTGSNNNGSVLTTTGTRDIYLRFKLTGDMIKGGPARQVTLRLWRLGVPNGDPVVNANVSIYAANNNWSETTLKWSNHPQVDTGSLLASNDVGTAGGVWVDFVLTLPDYVSGAGDYTFCLRSDATENLNFQSKEGGNAPQLVLQIAADNIGSDAEFTRYPTQVQESGARYRARYFALNGDGVAARADVENIGYFDVTKHPYNAKGDGSTDDTLAIQRAVNEARDARVAVYFPPRDAANKFYLVSNPIECVQGIVDYETQTALYENTYDERWNHRDYSSILIGPSALQTGEYRPRLGIANGAAAFSEAATPKAVLHFWSRGNVYNYTSNSGVPPTENYSAASYNHLVRYLDIDLSGNAGAIGIDMDGAQGTAIEKLTIHAQGAYAGISGLPGPGGGTTDVTIDGGAYGIKAYGPGVSDYSVLLTHCTLLADTTSPTHQVRSVAWSGLGAMVLVGCRIEGKGIRIDGSGNDGTFNASGVAWRGNMSIVDSTIEITGAAGPAVSGTRSLYLRNVYFKNVDPVADIRTVASPVTGVNDAGEVAGINPTGWFRVSEYYEGAYINQYPGQGTKFPDDGEGPEVTPAYIDPVGSGDITRTVGVMNLVAVNPAELAEGEQQRDRHAMPDVPMWNGANVINVKTWKTDGTEAKGDNNVDEAPAIQAAIDAADAAGLGQVVFIPRGEYRLKSTLVLKPGTVLFGLHKNLSRIKASEDDTGTPSVFLSGAPKPLVQSPDDDEATTWIADLMFLQRMSTPSAYLLLWQAGAGSVVQNINFDRRIVGSGKTMNFPLIKITGNGGGRWYNFQHQSSSWQNQNANSNYRTLLIDHTEQPLKFYMFNPETDSQNIYNVEIDHSANIDVFQSKFEGRASPAVLLSYSHNVRWFGVGGNAYTDPFPEISPGVFDREAGEGFFELYKSWDCLISSFANQANFLTTTTTAPDKFNRVKETRPDNSIIVTPGQKGIVLYRRGMPDDGVPSDPGSGNLPPTVQITSPVDGAQFGLAPVTLSATASDADSAVASVDFYANGNLVGSDATAPYEVTWTPATAGNYTLKAAAIDAAGGSASSAEVGVTVLASENQTELVLNSLGGEDGRVIESTATSEVGGNTFPNASGATALRMGDDGTNRQFRNIVSFDTSSIPAGAVIASASLELNRGNGAQGNTDDLGAILVDIRTGSFGTGPVLENVDFQSPATVTGVATMSVPAGEGAWSVGLLNQAGIDAINRSGGRTQFRVYYSVPDNGNNTQDFMPFFGGASTVPATRPILRITYAFPPVITASPANQSATAGDTVTFSVTASGTAPRSYQWRHDGVALTGNASAQTDTLTLVGVGTGAAGSYDCVVSNAAGSATSAAATLTVAPSGDGPVNLVLTSVSSEDGRIIESTATSEVGGNTFPNAAGSTALRLGDDGTNRQFRNIVSFDTSSIPAGAVITSASLELNQGNGAQGDTSGFGAILVDIRTGSFGTGPVLENADFQSPATATAVATMSVPASVGAWSVGVLNQAGLDAINRAGGRTQFRVYYAVPDNGNNTQDFLPFFGGASSTPGTQPILRIAYSQASAQAPIITASPTDQSVIAGSTVLFTVTATDPAPASLTYQWRRNGTALTGNASAQTTTLTLVGVGTGAAGSYDCVVSNAAGSATSAAAILTVAKAPAGVTLEGLSQVYDGTPRAATVTTAPGGLAVMLSYAGSATAPTNAGSYAVSATIVDPDYFGGAVGTLEVTRAPATIAFAELNQTYDGTPRVVTATTSPADLGVTLTYDGAVTAPMNAGTYAIAAVVTDSNYEGTAAGTLVVAQAAVPITLAPLNQLYDGTPRVVTVTSDPADLNVTLTYDGNTTAPVGPGSYEVTATVDDANYSGTVVDTLVVATAVTVRHAPNFNGALDGSVQVLLPENLTLNGNAWISGDLLMPGTPILQINGHPIYAGVLDGTGDAAPANHRVTLNGNSVLRYLVRRTDAVDLPVIAAPPSPAGTRNVSLNNSSQTIGDPATLRNLTLNGRLAPVALPPGTYGTLTLNGGNVLVLGTEGAEEAELYNLQGLVLNGNSALLLAGPVRLRLAGGVTLNTASAGDGLNPGWLTLEIASGGFTLNGNAAFDGSVIAPSGTVVINGNSTLRGRVTADRLTLNGNGLLEEVQP